MAYRLRPARETVEEGVRRIAAGQFGMVAQIIAEPDLPAARRIHETRRSLKRLRSLLKLIAPLSAIAAEEDVVLRNIARRLSDLRDQGALLETLDSLKPARALRGPLTAWLARADGPAASPGAADIVLPRLAPRIARSAERISQWQLDAGGIDALAPGLQQGYRRLRQRFRTARDSGEDEDIHDWRKCAKIHWHHALLLRQACPQAMDAHARMAGEIGDHLGDWRDAGLLLAAMRNLPGDDFPDGQIKRLRSLARQKQKTALKKAIRLSAWLTAEKPPALMARWRSYWQTAGGP